MLKPFVVTVASLFASVVSFAAPITLQLNWKPEPQFGGFYAGVVDNLFAKRQLDVKVQPGGAGTPTVQMVAAGKVEYAVVSADELVIARSRGIDVVALFAVYQTNPQGIMTRASRKFTSIADVFANPGILAMQRGLPYALFLEQKYGFDNVKIVPSPFGDLTAYRMREDYAMQCFITSEPMAATKIGIEPTTFLIADSGYNPYTTVLVTTGDHLRANKDEATRVVAAVREAWKTYLADPKPTNVYMQKLNPTMDAETFASSADAQKSLIETTETKEHGIGCMSLERWSRLIEQLEALKVIQTKPDPMECFVELK